MDLAYVMQALGMQWAVNLDGGGSSTMVINGQVVNNTYCNNEFCPGITGSVTYLRRCSHTGMWM